MFQSVYLNVNEARGYDAPFRKCAYISYGNLNAKDPLYAENLIAKKRIGMTEELPKNMQKLRNLALELSNSDSKEELVYSYNEFKGQLKISYSNYNFINATEVSLYVSDAALYNDEKTRDIVTTLNDPNNQYITDMIKEMESEYKLFVKINANTNSSIFTFAKEEKFFYIGIRMFKYKQMGDMRIQNLIDNRLYSKYFITEPFK